MFNADPQSSIYLQVKHMTFGRAIQDTSVPPRSVEEVARSLAYYSRVIRRHFPGLCQSLVKRYRDYNATQKEENFQRKLGALRQATYNLHKQGQYPSHRQVGKLLGKPGIFRDPKIHAIWQRTIYELD